MDNNPLHDDPGYPLYPVSPTSQPGPSAPSLTNLPSGNDNLGHRLPDLKAPPNQPNQPPPPYQMPQPPVQQGPPGPYGNPQPMSWQQPGGYPPPGPGQYYGPQGPPPYNVPPPWPQGSYNIPPRGPCAYNVPPGPYPGSYPQPQPQIQQQQQQTTVVIGGHAPVIHQPVVFAQSFTCHFVLSCFTLWLCNPLFGCIAFILAGIPNNMLNHKIYYYFIYQQFLFNPRDLQVGVMVFILSHFHDYSYCKVLSNHSDNIN